MSTDELRNTLENILDSHHEISQRAIDLVKINILSLSVIVTGVSFAGLNVSLTLAAGFVSFLYSIWSCIQVYHPREFNRGIGRKGGIDMDKAISNGISSSEFYRKVLYSYTDAIQKAEDAHEHEKSCFQNGLWASIAAILFFSVAGMIHISGGISFELEYPLLIVIPVLVLWGKDNTLE
ncbi:hypothetical protein E4P24_08455 [Haloferax sp. AS1]|uniref:hypothetical protein n=1 Tax=Haloferax sp. AS1 TaxID=2562277 RepID=UPI00165EDA36|nr:hypothetical protein [Haloferax sp. AS1]MBC9986406.1 hypothetical protein [Haloferax sp. AS1]